MATAKKKEPEVLYVRNARPNRVVVKFEGQREMLEHRGHRGDSTALPLGAKNDPVIARWLRIGQLEEISKEAFMKLRARTIDVLPNQYLKQDMRTPRGLGVGLSPAEADAGKTLTQVDDRDVKKHVAETLSPQWAGELMETEEELEILGEQYEQHQTYPSRHRDDGERRQMGY